MVTPKCVAWAVNLIYGAYGRPVDEAILEAYLIALQDRTDWQLMRAVKSELPRLSKYPIDAAALNVAAAKFKRSEADEIAAEHAEQERLALPKPYDDFEQRCKANGKALRDELKAMIAANEFKQAGDGSFSREMLEVLETCEGDPVLEVSKVLFGIRQRRKNQRQQTKTNADLRHAITRANREHA